MFLSNEINVKTFLQFLFVAAAVTYLLTGCSQTKGKEKVDLSQDEEIIWAKELAIFQGRTAGDLSFYIDAADKSYVAWPYGIEEPIDYQTLKSQAHMGAAIKGEITELTKKKIVITGDTAQSYFLNHRTRLGEGMASEGERDVDRYFDNIHVWARIEGEWKIIGGLSRPSVEK